MAKRYPAEFKQNIMALCQLVLVESFETYLTLCQMRFCLLSNQGDPVKEVGQIPGTVPCQVDTLNNKFLIYW